MNEVTANDGLITCVLLEEKRTRICSVSIENGATPATERGLKDLLAFHHLPHPRHPPVSAFLLLNPGHQRLIVH